MTSKRVRPPTLLIHAALLASVAVMLLPYYLMVITAIKPLQEIFTDPFTWFPSHVEWRNFVDAWTHAPFGRYFINSTVISVAETLGVLVTSALAGYAFARMRFRGRELLFVIFLGTLMVPGEVQLVPNYITVSRLGWLNTYYALIVPFLSSVFGIFFMRQFFATIPNELQDAARIDGASHWTFLWRVVVPLSKPAFITVALLTFLGSWNALTWPLIVTNTPEMRPIMVGLLSFSSEWGTQPRLLMAAATFSVLPVLVLFFVLQRYFIQGIARAGMKF
ncbi:MAG TPA: carbohydrate ABC transporter permease [bacterium]|nr:carbohydrate ABC transporter permease [bacterium]